MRGVKRKGIRPVYDIQLGPLADEGYVRRLAFRRAWLFIGVLLVFDLIFLVPAISAFHQAAAEWARFEDLFGLVSALFLSAWLLGWSIAPLLMTTALALMVFGRETLRVTPGTVELVVGLPGLGLRARYRLSAVRNLRLESPAKKSGKSWRGPHAAFDYGANSGAFGSGLDEADLAEIRRNIEAAGRQPIQTRDATAKELEGDWPRPGVEALAGTEAEGPPAGPAEPLSLASPSAIALILANLVPVAGALWWGWDLGIVLVLYWAESAVVGFFNLCKIVVIAKWLGLLAGIFFISHFGAFMVVHFLFLYGIFVEGFSSDSGGDLAAVVAMFGRLWPAIAGLFISHGLSFLVNFMGRDEYRRRTIRTQMTEPYSRIVFMHLVLIIGGGAALVLGDTVPVLMAIIVAKIIVDLRAHLRQHGAG